MGRFSGGYQRVDGRLTAVPLGRRRTDGTIRTGILRISPTAIALAFGFTVGLGNISGAWIFADAVLVALALAALLSGYRPRWWAWLIPLAVALSGQPDGASTVSLWYALRLAAMVPVVGLLIERRDQLNMVALGLGLMLGAVVHVPAIFMGYHGTSGRAAGVTLNAVMLGQIGLAFFLMAMGTRLMVPPRQISLAFFSFGAFFILASGTRSAALVVVAAGVLALLYRRWGWWAVCVALVIAFSGLHYHRFETIWNDLGVRVDLNEGAVPDNAGLGAPLGDPEFTPTGYGLGAYVQTLNAQRPHNIPVLLFWTLGGLILIPGGLVVWAVATRRVPAITIIAIVVFGALNAEPVSGPPGQYVWALIFAVTCQAGGLPLPRPGWGATWARSMPGWRQIRAER